MKFDTLITRYKTLGYEPMGLDEHLEITNLIKWLYDTHEIYTTVQYMSPIGKICLKFKHGGFLGVKYNVYKEGKDIIEMNRFYTEKCHPTPYDALFDSLREGLPGLGHLKFKSLR